MSVYTETEHAIALADTQYWILHPPIKLSDFYSYAQYQFRLRDYSQAFFYFCKCAKAKYLPAWFDISICIWKDLINEEDLCFLPPDCDPMSMAYAYYQKKAATQKNDPISLYRLAFLLRYGIGGDCNPKEAYVLFQKVLFFYRDLKKEDFDINCDYSYQGSHISSQTDLCKLPFGACLFEVALFYANGIDPIPFNPKEARAYLKKAYDFHCFEALEYDFSKYADTFASYEYQDEIKELYSFHLGQSIRVYETNPSKKSANLCKEFYLQGFPGDSEGKKLAFSKKADLFFKD